MIDRSVVSDVGKSAFPKCWRLSQMQKMQISRSLPA
jgi:hypothetical protein